ncbi:uncharacterized protein BJX67DRAFT_371321 [Aspergillus lucknowensis]|uniref:Uncharacterized protein n=1 Tax=Aspergillus lucknowensis TaxID=176173 RepID=A0ABR4LVS2_9EURO
MKLQPALFGDPASSFPANANHIFNAIHSSMRQWGSSLNHNGMSFFLATVPEGTQLYHGNWRPDPVQGPEWLTFEPEHALVFTHPFPHNPPPKDEWRQSQPEPPLQPQQVIRGSNQAEDGYLHTFAAAKDLRLLYIDGMSAGKTQNGTMASQGRILFTNGLKGGGGGMMDEHIRAQIFCRTVQEKWDGRLDGMIRMEAGFVIILCDFARDLELLRVTRVRPSEKGVPGEQIGHHAARIWLPAVASRYWGIGGERVILNYEHFIGTPPPDDLEPMRRGLDALILDHETSESFTNWQAVADMEIEDVVTPFLDYQQRNMSAETERCSRQFIRRSTPITTAAGAAVLSVTRSICATMLEALHHTGYHKIVDQIQGLMGYLSWTTWKDCNGCGDHEICMFPMWPLGTVDDYKHPQCRDFAQLNGDGRFNHPKLQRTHRSDF